MNSIQPMINQDTQSDLFERHMESHVEMIRIIESLFESAAGDKDLRFWLSKLDGHRMDAEFIAAGPEWARYFMEENEWDAADVSKTLARLFGTSTEAA